jgi:hypothetical protein
MAARQLYIPALGRLKQENLQFEACLGYIYKIKASWGCILRPSLKQIEDKT